MSDKDLYDQWRQADRDEPSASLDARILAAAHEAAGESPRRRRPSWVARFAPLSVAAVAVLGVALSMRVAEEEPGLRQSLPPPSAPAKKTDASAGEPVPAAAAPAEKVSISAEAKARAEHPLRDQAGEVPAPARESFERRGDVATEADAATIGRKRAAEAARPASVPAVPAAALREEAPPAGGQLTAASWLAEIERLLAVGEIEAARQSLRRFRLAHPGHPLPDALARLGAE